MSEQGTKEGHIARLLDAVGAGKTFAERSCVGQFSADAAKGAKLVQDADAGQATTARLHRALDQLTAAEKRLVVWHIDGVPQKAVARHLGVTAQTVGRRTGLAMAKLRAAMGAPCP